MYDERLLTPASVLNSELPDEVSDKERVGLGGGVALGERHVRLSKVVYRQGETDSRSPLLLRN
jgi:hypothetical protein